MEKWSGKVPNWELEPVGSEEKNKEQKTTQVEVLRAEIKEIEKSMPPLLKQRRWHF